MNGSSEIVGSIVRRSSSDTSVAMATVLQVISARRNEFSSLGYIPSDVIDCMKAAGIFRAGVPKCLGGDALPPHQFLQTIESLSTVDGSSGWVAAFGSANTYLAALPLDTQKMIYETGPDQVFSGALYPMQQAERIERGWCATGRWKFASGSMGADWLGVGLLPKKKHTNNEIIKPITAVFPKKEVKIIHNWNVIGMRGTGSHDLVLDGAFVADEWTFERGSMSIIDEPLYRFPAICYQAAVHAAVALGLARAALDELYTAVAGDTRNTGAPALIDRSYVRAGLGKAEAELRSARCFFYETNECAWSDLVSGREINIDMKNLLRLSATQAARTALAVGQKSYELYGIGAIYNANRVSNIIRDLLVISQHAFLGESTWDGAGSLFAGRTPVVPYP